MTKFFKTKSFKILQGLLFVSIVGCSVSNAPLSAPCPRKCGNRPISGGPLMAINLSPDVSYKLRVESTGTSTKFACGSSGEIDTLDMRFLVYEDTSPPSASSSSGSSGGTNSGGAAAASSSSTVEQGAQAAIPKRIPKAGVAFFPNIVGGTIDTEDYNTATPATEWCTDACGIATLTVRPTCTEQEMGVSIIVPGLTGEVNNATEVPVKPIKVTIAKPE